MFRAELDGFESSHYVIFTASDLSVTENLHAAGAIVGPIERALERI